MFAAYHNHTTLSEGKTSVSERCDAAFGKGVRDLGISDHFCVFPDGSTRPWSMVSSKVDEYISEIRSYNRGPSAFAKIGLEIEWFTDHHSILPPLIEGLELDFRMGSLHHVGEAFFDDCFAPKRSEEDRLEMWRKYWTLKRKMAERGFFA